MPAGNLPRAARMFCVTLCISMATSGCVLDWSRKDEKKANEDAGRAGDAGLTGDSGHDGGVDNNACSANPCGDGGKCEETKTGFTCTCAAGYAGTQCETSTNECAPNPCENGGTCQKGINAFACTCPAGYSGTRCETNIDECAPNPCQNGGTCTDKDNDYSCACPADKLGKQCELKVCGEVVIETKEALDANRLCAEIRGDLSIFTGTAGGITDSDFPFLTKITGRLLVGSEGATGLPVEVTMSALQTVTGNTLFYLSARVTALRFPKLETVGGQFGVTSFVSVKSMDFPALTVVGGDFNLQTNTALCSVSFPKMATIAGTVGVWDAARVPPSSLRPVFAAANPRVPTISNLGCCFGPEAVQCDRAYTVEECACN